LQAEKQNRNAPDLMAAAAASGRSWLNEMKKPMPAIFPPFDRF
jgi:hypothetical protein